MDRFGARPWRMGRADYEAAVQAGGTVVAGSDETAPSPPAGIPADGAPLTAAPEAASWDPYLAAALAAYGRAVHEEILIEVLLEDLKGWR